MASEMRLAAVQKLLEGAGYRLARIHGSHYIFVKPGAAGISIPVRKGKVKPVYVRQVEKIIRESSA